MVLRTHQDTRHPSSVLPWWMMMCGRGLIGSMRFVSATTSGLSPQCGGELVDIVPVTTMCPLQLQDAIAEVAPLPLPGSGVFHKAVMIAWTDHRPS